MPLYRYIYFIFLQTPFTRIQQLESSQRYDCLLEGKWFWKEDQSYTENFPCPSTQVMFMYMKDASIGLVLKRVIFIGL